MEITKIFINDCKATGFDQIAFINGWKLGFNSGLKKIKKLNQCYMIDNNWKKYDHRHHLALIKLNKPQIATVRDIESKEQLKDVFNQTLEILDYVNKVVLIPKIDCAKEVEKFLNKQQILPARILLGIPCGRYSNTCSLFTINRLDFLQIHLLGGSPKHWQEKINFYQEKIFSVDGNYAAKIARYGKILTPLNSRKPMLYEVKQGKDFVYRCFQKSLENINNYDFLKYRQLSLF